MRHPSAGSALRGISEFFLAPASPAPLGTFRIGIATVGLLHMTLVWPYLFQLYGPLGWVQWLIGESVAPAGVMRLSWLIRVLGPFGVNPGTGVWIVAVAYVASLAGLLVGWRSRFMGVVAWLFHLALTTSGFFSTYGVDIFLHLGLFYCAWMPTGEAFSIRSGMRRSRPPSWQAGLSLRTLQLHLSIVYFTSGLAKARGSQWWSGEAIWRSVSQPRFAQFDLSWLASVPLLAMVIGWSVIVIETGYPLFIAFKKTRGLWLLATCGMHLGIGIFLGLHLFALIMLVWNVAVFGVPWFAERRSGGPQIQLQPRRA